MFLRLSWFVLPDSTGDITPHSPFETRNLNISSPSNFEPLSEGNLFFTSDAESFTTGSDAKPQEYQREHSVVPLGEEKKYIVSVCPNAGSPTECLSYGKNGLNTVTAFSRNTPAKGAASPVKNKLLLLLLWKPFKDKSFPYSCFPTT